MRDVQENKEKKKSKETSVNVMLPSDGFKRGKKKKTGGQKGGARYKGKKVKETLKKNRKVRRKDTKE